MSKSETAVIIVDSSSFDFSFQGFWENTSGAFQYIGLDSAYLNTTRDSLDRLGNFTFTFEGFGVTFVGIPPRPAPSTFPISTITIDPDSPQSLGVPASNGIPISYFEPWYKTPDLPYGTHTIFMTHCYAMAVDYALVVVGPDTELDGKTIFVDDNDPQIQYHGSGWKINNTSVYDSNHDRILTTAQNTTRQTTQVGDSFSFAFLGTSASVYGLFAWGNISSLVLQFELDGNVTSKTYNIGEVDLFGSEWSINFPFISYDNLPAGDHLLNITAKEIRNTTFRFDYITYLPAFSTLASINVTSTGNSSSTVFTPAPVADSDDLHGQHLELKVVVGSVLGGLALLAIAVGCLVWWHRRLNSQRPVGKQSDASNEQEAHGTHDIVPFPPEKMGTAASTPPVIFDRVKNATTSTPYPQEKLPNLTPSPQGTATRPVHGQVQTTMTAIAMPYPHDKLPRIIQPPLEDATTQGSNQHPTVSQNKTRTEILDADSSAPNPPPAPQLNPPSQLPLLAPLRRQDIPSPQVPDGALPPSYASAWSE